MSLSIDDDNPSIATVSLRWLMSDKASLWTGTVSKLQGDKKAAAIKLADEGWTWNKDKGNYEDVLLETKTRWKGSKHRKEWYDAVKQAKGDCFLASITLSLEGWFWNGNDMDFSSDIELMNLLIKSDNPPQAIKKYLN